MGRAIPYAGFVRDPARQGKSIIRARHSSGAATCAASQPARLPRNNSRSHTMANNKSTQTSVSTDSGRAKPPDTSDKTPKITGPITPPTSAKVKNSLPARCCQRNFA